MKRSRIYSFTLLGFIGLFAMFYVAWQGLASQPDTAILTPDTGIDVVAAPGRVEPISEEINVGSEVGGRLKDLPAEEGERVQRGQIIAVLENSDYRARVASAEARLRLKEAELQRIVNGARAQERQVARAEVMEAEAMMQNSRTEWKRRQQLYQAGVVSREVAGRAEVEYWATEARYRAALQRHALLEDEARAEDRLKGEADVALARALLQEARAQLDKTTIRSPITGVILRKYLKTGESVTEERPIFRVADDSVLRVRVDVDEADVNKVRIGLRGFATARAYPGMKFWGRVVRIGRVLGRKNIRTEEPTERVDTKILETSLELDQGYDLPIGLRVDVFLILGDDSEVDGHKNLKP